MTSVPYGRRDGMRSSECNGGGQPRAVRAADGRIWFPTQQGVAVFDPDSIPVQTEPPLVVITGFSVGERPLSARGGIAIQPADPRSVEVRFAALTFIRPELTRFRYRMEGLEAGWTDAGAVRAARFAQLPYGTYTFHVIAANRDGIWNTAGASVRIAVVAPFWRTRWFAALATACAAGLGLVLHRRRIAHLRRLDAVRADFSRRLIETQENDRRRIAAELHDGLQQNLVVIRNWALLGRRALPGDHAVQQRLGEIESAAAVALDEVRQAVHDLAPHNLDRLGLADTIAEMVARVGDASNIRFQCRLPEVTAPLPAAAQTTIYRVVQEAVNNVVKHSGAAQAWVEMEIGSAALQLTVRDDGRGFAPADVAARGRHGGFGLDNMAERLRMIRGSLAVHSAPGAGTTLTIQVPLPS